MRINKIISFDEDQRRLLRKKALEKGFKIDAERIAKEEGISVFQFVPVSLKLKGKSIQEIADEYGEIPFNYLLSNEACFWSSTEDGFANAILRQMEKDAKVAFPKGENNSEMLDYSEKDSVNELMSPQKPLRVIDKSKKKSRKGDDFFLKTSRRLIRNEEYRKAFKNKGWSVLYEYIWSRIVRKGWRDNEKYQIKAKYYDNGKLAFCSSIRYLARECGLNKNTVHKILRSWSKLGIAKLEFIRPKGLKIEQAVVILGEWSEDEVGKVKEEFYRETVFEDNTDGH